MADEAQKQTYEEKEGRLDEILKRLDNSETPMDELASEAREAAGLISSMYETIKGAKQEIVEVFADMEKMKETMNAGMRPEPGPGEGKSGR